MNYNTLPQGVRLAVEAAQNKKAAGISVLDADGMPIELSRKGWEHG